MRANGQEREKWVRVCTPRDVWKGVLNQLHVRTSSVSSLGNGFSTQRPVASKAVASSASAADKY